MRSDSGWHDLLEASIPEPEVPTDALRRLDASVRAAKRRRRIMIAALPLGAATLATAAIAVADSVPSGHRHPRSPSAVVSPVVKSSARLAAELTGTVAYKCGDSLCLMNPDGTEKRTLDATFPEWDPAWSPNGQQLAFRGYYATGDGSYAIYRVDTDGCHVTRLPGTDGGVTPSWSPDGRQIAFGSGYIRVIDSDGTHLHAVTDGGVTVNDRYIDTQPSWSPTGSIAFVRTDRGSSEGEIYTVHPDGSHLSAITTGGPGFDQPAWSPDGSQLAMVAATNGNTMIGAPLQVDVANADGTDLHAVSPPGWSSYNPTWTPDGRIVFLVDDGGTDAYSINADGTDLRQLYGNLGGPERVWQITWGSRPLTPAKCGS